MIRIEVTQEDIDKGIRGSACECAVALAATRAFNGRKVAATAQYLCFDHGKQIPHKHIVVPTEVALWIHAYDLEQVVKPFSFIIEERYVQE